MRTVIHELGGYAVGSMAALALDVALLTFLVEAVGWHYLLAAAVSFIAGSVFLYWLSVRFVFSFSRLHEGALALSWFVALGGLGLLVNMIAVYIGMEGLRMPLIVSKLGAAGCSFAANFVLRRHFLFSRSFE